jgi:hypothetical protein
MYMHEIDNLRPYGTFPSRMTNIDINTYEYINVYMNEYMLVDIHIYIYKYTYMHIDHMHISIGNNEYGCKKMNTCLDNSMHYMYISMF